MRMPALLVEQIAASFLSRGGTATPLKVALIRVAVDVALWSRCFSPSARLTGARDRCSPLDQGRRVFPLVRRTAEPLPIPTCSRFRAATLFAARAAGACGWRSLTSH